MAAPSTDLPHEYLTAWLIDALGRRAALFGTSLDESIRPLVIGVADQLAIYTTLRPFARLGTGRPGLREGAQRSYVLVPVHDGGKPLRLQQTMQWWAPAADTNWLPVFVESIVGMRWRFIWRHLALLHALVTGVADMVLVYYLRRGTTASWYRMRERRCMQIGLLRILEDVDRTWLCVEIDDRSEEAARDTVDRYRVQ